MSLLNHNPKAIYKGGRQLIISSIMILSKTSQVDKLVKPGNLNLILSMIQHSSFKFTKEERMPITQLLKPIQPNC